MIVTYSIVAVPKRREYALKLLGQFPEGSDVRITYDFFMEGSWNGAKKGWKAMPEYSTHHIALEEDAVLCTNFVEHVKSIIDALPNDLISLYSGRQQKAGCEWARKSSYNYFISNYAPSGVAVIMPAWMVREFLEWEAQRVNPAMPYEDTRMHGYVVEHGYKTYFTVPSIVEHGAPMESSLGFNNKGKVAYDFIGEGREVDWGKVPDGSVRFSKQVVGKSVWERYHGS
jgi:hypothetical protein